jgi:hypothetical protein
MISALQQVMKDTQDIIGHQLAQTDDSGASAAKQSAAVVNAMESMQRQYAELLQDNKEVSAEVRTSLQASLQSMTQQQANSDQTSLAGSAATQEMLAVVMTSLEDSRKEVRLLTAMSEAQHQLLTEVEERGNLLPSKFIILPDIQQVATTASTKVGGIFKKLKNKAWRVLWKKVRLFFVCDVSNTCALTGGPQKVGYEIDIPSTMLKYLRPVLLGSLVVLKIVLQAQGLPAGLIPSFPDTLGSSALLETLKEHFPSEGDMAEHVTTSVEDVGRSENLSEEELLSAGGVQEGRLDVLLKLVQKSEKCTGQPLVGWTPQFTGLERVSVRAVAGVLGASKWVLKEHRALYEEHGERTAALLLQDMHLLPPPPYSHPNK